MPHHSTPFLTIIILIPQFQHPYPLTKPSSTPKPESSNIFKPNQYHVSRYQSPRTPVSLYPDHNPSPLSTGSGQGRALPYEAPGYLDQVRNRLLLQLQSNDEKTPARTKLRGLHSGIVRAGRREVDEIC